MLIKTLALDNNSNHQLSIECRPVECFLASNAIQGSLRAIFSCLPFEDGITLGGASQAKRNWRQNQICVPFITTQGFAAHGDKDG